MSIPAVELRGVSRRYGTVQALHETSLTVERGEFLTLLGPSGCGKTTLLGLVAGFAEPDSGRVFIFGRDVTDLPTFLRDVGVVFQNYALFPHMSVAENVAFGLRLRKLSRRVIRESVDAVLGTVRMRGTERRRPSELSGGQQQRVALARALVVQPKVLLLDEPLSALDKNLRSEMQVELKQIQQQVGITTIFVTHDQSEALSLSDRVAVMDSGQIRQISRPVEIYRNPENAFVASFVGEINRVPVSIVDRTESFVTVELPTGTRKSVPVARSTLNGGYSGEAVLFVRTHGIQIVPRERAEFLGRVITQSYLGTHLEVLFAVDHMPAIRIRVTGNDCLPSHEADTLHGLAIAEDAVVLLSPTLAKT